MGRERVQRRHPLSTAGNDTAMNESDGRAGRKDRSRSRKKKRADLARKELQERGEEKALSWREMMARASRSPSLSSSSSSSSGSDSDGSGISAGQRRRRRSWGFEESMGGGISSDRVRALYDRCDGFMITFLHCPWYVHSVHGMFMLFSSTIPVPCLFILPYRCIDLQQSRGSWCCYDFFDIRWLLYVRGCTRIRSDEDPLPLGSCVIRTGSARTLHEIHHSRIAVRAFANSEVNGRC